MVDIQILQYAIINIILGIILFVIGRSLHEIAHYLIAKCYKIPNIKIDFNITRNPFQGAKIVFEDKFYFYLSKSEKFVLLSAGYITQLLFYMGCWLTLFVLIQDSRFKFLFSLMLFALIIPDFLINSISKKGDLNRLLRL